jgi:hypothetical protein
VHDAFDAGDVVERVKGDVSPKAGSIGGHGVRVTDFEGSLGQMMTALVRNESWTDEGLDALRAEIERARKGRKS